MPESTDWEEAYGPDQSTELQPADEFVYMDTVKYEPSLDAAYSVQ